MSEIPTPLRRRLPDLPDPGLRLDARDGLLGPDGHQDRRGARGRWTGSSTTCSSSPRSSRRIPRNVDVGVLAYSTRRDGQPRLRPLLPGPSPGRPLLPLAALAGPAAGHRRRRPSRQDRDRTLGRGPGSCRARSTRPACSPDGPPNTPGRRPPVVVHCTDGETSDGPIGGDVASLTDAVPGAIIVHCLFRRGMAPSAFIPAPGNALVATSGP